MTEYTAMIVEPDGDLMQQISATVQNAPGFSIIASYTDMQAAVSQGIIFHPDLIFLDADYLDGYDIISKFAEKFPGARVFCIGEKWTLPVFRAVLQAGASGYLVRPFTSKELTEGIGSLENDSEDSLALNFFSPKGKSGRSTLIANLAFSLAEKTGKKVGIIDADLQFGDLSLFFNVVPQGTIVEAVRDLSFLSPLTLASYFTPAADHVSILCSPKRPEYAGQISAADITALIQMAKGIFSYVLIDVPPAFNLISIAAAEASDKTIVVAMISAGFEVLHVKRALEIFKVWPDYAQKVYVVFTRTDPCTEETREKLATELGYPVFAVIPNEYLLLSEAGNQGNILTQKKPNAEFSVSVRSMAEGIGRLQGKEMPS